jgi:hypothetical protein
MSKEYATRDDLVTVNLIRLPNTFQTAAALHGAAEDAWVSPIQRSPLGLGPLRLLPDTRVVVVTTCIHASAVLQ